MIALALVLVGPPLPPPPPPDEPVATDEVGEAVVGTEDAPVEPSDPANESSSVIGEPVNPAATSDLPASPSTTTSATGGEKPPPSEDAIARDSTVPPAKPLKKRARWQRPGTKQRFAFEFKMGPYLPEIDNGYGGTGFGPYATVFGRTNDRGETTKEPLPGVMPAVSFEYQFVYVGGPLGVGLQAAFYRDRANALYAEARPDDDGVRSSADKVTFGMVPLSVFLVYRFELAADFFRVPLVPYMKAGLSYSFWWMKNGAGEIARNVAGEKGRGGVVGWQLNPGIMLRMDFIEPGTAKKLDQATGINHTYLFGEFQLTRLRNFGVGNSIDLGDKTFFAGLALEF
jgi:hypothetical protein